MRRSEFKTLVTIGIIGAIVAASIYGGYIDFTPSTISTDGDDDDELDTTATVTIENPYDLPDGMSIDDVSYIIFKNGTQICAKNGTSGYTEYTGTDLNSILNILGPSNKNIFITGTYTFDTVTGLSVTGFSVEISANNCTIYGNAVFDCRATYDTSWAYLCITGDHNTISGLRFNFLFSTTVVAKRGIMTIGNDTIVQDCTFIGQGKGTAIDTKQYSTICYGYQFRDNYIENTSGIALHSSIGALISGNTMMDIPGVAIQLYSYATYTIVTGNYLENRYASIVEDSEGIFLGHGTTAPGTVNNNTISQNMIINYGRNYNHINTTGNIWLNNIIKHTIGVATAGIESTHDSNNKIIGNNIFSYASSGFHAIVLSDVLGAVVNDNNINCYADTSQVSIVLRPGYGAQIEGNDITGLRGIFLSNGYDVVIKDNVLASNGSGLYGIFLGYANLLSSHVTIEGNYVSGYATASIRAPLTYSDNVSIFNNVVDDLIQNYGANAKTWNNVGYVTEASGIVTIASGTTSIIVTHGMATTPTKVIASGSSNDTASLYITSVGINTFTINSNETVGDNRNIYWYAEV